MADLITIKGGSGAVPVLQDRELGYRKDEKALYIGTPNGNERLFGANDVASINAKLTEINNKITEINGAIDSINARLNALTTE